MPFSLGENTLKTACTQKRRVGNFPFSKIMHEHFSPWRNQFVHSSAQALYLSKITLRRDRDPRVRSTALVNAARVNLPT